MNTIATGKKAMLRDALPSDADAYVQWWTHGEWLSYDAPWEATAKTFPNEEAVERFRQGFAKQFIDDLPTPRTRAIIATRGGDPIGWVNSYSEKRFPDVTSVGIDICDDTHLNQGLGTEALQLWVDYLFGNTDLHRVGVGTYSFNPRMVRVAEKVGFVQEGADREIVLWQGQWPDRIRFSMLRAEWERLNTGRAASSTADEPSHRPTRTGQG